MKLFFEIAIVVIVVIDKDYDQDYDNEKKQSVSFQRRLVISKEHIEHMHFCPIC